MICRVFLGHPFPSKSLADAPGKGKKLGHSQTGHWSSGPHATAGYFSRRRNSSSRDSESLGTNKNGLNPIPGKSWAFKWLLSSGPKVPTWGTQHGAPTGKHGSSKVRLPDCTHFQTGLCLSHLSAERKEAPHISRCQSILGHFE